MGYIREALDGILEEENKKEIDAELYDDWTIEDEEDFNTYDEDDPLTPEQEAFANELRAFLQSLINEEEQDDDELEEKFTSQQSLTKHFNRHCLANTPNRKSTKNNIYYDFTSLKQYSNYEQKLYNIFRQGVSNSKEKYDFIDDIFDVNDVNKKFTKLFEGNFTLFISGIFGLRNSKGTVNLGIHAFSSDVTTNYIGGNTLDICILSPSIKSITLYPVDATTIKREIVRIINKYSQLSLTPSKDDKKLLDNLNEREDEDLKETSPYTNIKSNGIYSLNTGWVKHPVQQDIPDIDMEEFEKEFKVWEDKYFDLLDKESSKEEIDNLIEDIYNLRKEGMEEDGEYSIKNLIFKEFRNLGYLDNLKELRKKEISKELSLESLKEELINYSNEDETNYKTKEIMGAISQEFKNPFVKYMSLDWLSYGDVIKDCDYRDLVKLVVPYIIFNDTDYSVYFTDKLGWEGGNDYIITRKETTLKNLYKVFKRDWEEQEETLSKEEFEDHMFTIDKNGNYTNVKID